LFIGGSNGGLPDSIVGYEFPAYCFDVLFHVAGRIMGSRPEPAISSSAMRAKWRIGRRMLCLVEAHTAHVF
jgi:hypothetical protein